VQMPRVKRLFKPPMDNPQAVFLYGKECGIDEEHERIVALLTEEASLLSDSDALFVLAIIDLIKGENE
jgi:hypothetical protein